MGSMSEEEGAKCPIALKTAIQMMPAECGNTDEFIMQLGQLVYGLKPDEVPSESECRRVMIRSISINPKRAVQYVLCRLRTHLAAGMDADKALAKAWEEANAKL